MWGGKISNSDDISVRTNDVLEAFHFTLIRKTVWSVATGRVTQFNQRSLRFEFARASLNDLNDRGGRVGPLIANKRHSASSNSVDLILSTDEIAALIGRHKSGQPALAPEFVDDPKRA